MCGIFAYLGNKQTAAQLTLEALKSLEYRGYDSWGVAWMTDENKIEFEKKVGKIGDATLSVTTHSSSAIGHTRWATHGKVTTINAHPHLSEDGRYAVVHNGIVENYLNLQKSLEHKGHVFTSQTDSEVIVHLVEELAKTSSFKEAVRRAFLQLQGLNAFVVMDAKTGHIITVKNGSPLIVGRDEENQWYLASDAVALAPHTKTIYVLNDDEMVIFEPTVLKLYDATSGDEKEIKWETLQFDARDTSLGEYSHFLMKEIAQQPAVIRTLLASDIPTDFIKNNKDKRWWLVGCGTGGYAALFGQYIFLKAGIDARAVAGSEFGAYLDIVSQNDIVIFLSQSGETIDLIEHLTSLVKRNVPVFAIVNREGSTLARLADSVLYLHAGPEQCVLATKSLIAKLVTLLLLGSIDQKKSKAMISKAVVAIDAMVSNSYRETVIHPIAKKLANAHDIFIIGRGVSYPIALEAMMKIREVTYRHAEGIAGGELKHGTIALIEQGTPCIVCAPNDEHYSEIISNTMELKARGAYIIGIGWKSESCFDEYIHVPDCEDATGIAMIVPVQLLAYEMAVLLGRDPDKPRNLAKSVTVK